MIFIINYSFLLLYIHYIKSVLPIFISTELYRQYYVQEDRSFMEDSEVYEEIQPILLQQQLDYYQFLYDYHHPSQEYQTKFTLTESGSKTQMTFPYSEYLALEFLYNSTNGPYWRWFNFTWTDSNITNYIQHQIHLPFHIFNFTVGSIPWNFTKYGENNPCTDNWQGIICSCTPTTCHVTQLDLDQHNMSGILPLQFGDLTELIALSFRKNNITGILPATMGQMKNLILLNLESNSFTGGLENWFGNFTNLLLVGVSINFFNSLSTGFYSLKQLLFLDLGINNFYGPLPTQFGNHFPLLRETLIFGNSFSGRIPESMINLTQLRLFDADFNDFTGPFPTVFCSLVNMTALSIGTNHFTGTIPENITNLILLQRLFLASNQFFGTIPQMIGQLNQLLFFNVDKNILSGSLPDSFSELKRLNVILLYENSFTGTISSNNFPIESTSINYLYLQYNHFHGEVEEVFNHAPTLIFFVLTSNMFSGPLPNVNSKLLYEYFAGKNCFTGTISPRFANLTSLRFFYSGSNYLHGSLPSIFITSIFIANINVSTNLLTGTLPPSLGKLVNMDQLFFDHNFFTGTPPSSYGDLKQLVVLSLANNDLVGSIPSSYGGFTVLQEIFLEHNRFTGNIADVMRMFNQRFIVNVDLTDNQFTGTLAPSYFTNNTQTLQTFSASLNCLSGSIPTEICSVNSLNALSLDGLTTAENCRSYIFPALSQWLVLSSRYVLYDRPSLIVSLQ